MKVTKFRLSCVWVEGAPEVLGDHDSVPLGNLVRVDPYAQRFEQLLKNDADPLVTIPWPRSAGQTFSVSSNFWNKYIVKSLSDHRTDPGGQAWRAAVPLRHKGSLVALERPQRSFVEGWYYPHGVAVTLTAWFEGDYDAAALEATINTFMLGALPFRWSDPGPETPTINSMADRALTTLRKAAFGAAPPVYRDAPLRILTIIGARVDGGESVDAVAQATKGIVAAALSAAGAPADGSVKPDRDVYSFSKGHVVWRADRAMSPETLHTLGCLHRNLTLATLQCESIIRCAEILRAELDTYNHLPQRVQHYASTIGKLLGRLYGGADTYASPAVRQRIALANEHGEIDAFLTKLGLKALYLPKPQ